MRRKPSTGERGQSREKLGTTEEAAPTPSWPKSWKCPNCWKRIDIDRTGTELVDHPNARGQRCAGSGYQLPQKSSDALDYRLAGSFEGGRR